MSSIHAQVHHHFKIFAGGFDSSGGITTLAEQVASWVSQSGAAAKSIGVEYLESSGQLLLSVGYRTDEPGYAVRLHTVNVGKVEALDAAGLAELEGRMGRAAAEVGNIICHELFVTADHTVHMVFLLYV